MTQAAAGRGWIAIIVLLLAIPGCRGDDDAPATPEEAAADPALPSPPALPSLGDLEDLAVEGEGPTSLRARFGELERFRVEILQTARSRIPDREPLEHRMRQIFTAPGQAGAVAERWAERLQGHAEVVLRDQAIAAGWFGEVADHHRQRIGDVLAVARGNSKLTAPTRDGRISGLRGQHGALTEAEMLIPLVVIDN